MPDYISEYQFETAITVEGKRYIGKTRDGGETEADGGKIRAGGMGPEIALGGPNSTGDVTVAIALDRDGINADLVWLRSRSGKARATVVQQPLDADGNVRGKAEIHSGILAGVSTGGSDADGNEAVMVELTVSCDEAVA